MRVGHVWMGGGPHLAQALGYPEDVIIKESSEVLKVDLMVLHGGEDICPQLYNQHPAMTGAKRISARDSLEFNCIETALEKEIPILGICRGMQMLTAVDGGSLFQHVTGHSNGKYHAITTTDGDRFGVNSFHHQMCRIAPHSRVLAVASEMLSPHKWVDSQKPEEFSEPEVEAAFFPKLNAIGVQFHPEWMTQDEPGSRYTRSTLKEYLGV